MDLLYSVLQPGLKVLQVLDLGENSLGNEGIQVIREPLIANNTLKELGLARTSITCEGTTALTIKQLPHVFNAGALVTAGLFIFVKLEQ